MVANSSAFFSTVVRPRAIFSIADKLQYDLADCAEYQQGEESQAHDIAINHLTNKLPSLDFVWRPLELQITQSNLHGKNVFSKNIRQLNNQLKQATPFIKFVTKTMLTQKISDDEQVFCFAMLYNTTSGEDMRTRQAEDDFEMDNYENEESRPSQWTAVIATTLSKQTNQVTKSVMVLKAPDAVQAFTKESLINILDIAETIGCEKVVVAINKGMLPATEKVQILKAFMYVGFEMVHPSVMNVDNHILLGYDL